jgi:hypothetical protein
MKQNVTDNVAVEVELSNGQNTPRYNFDTTILVRKPVNIDALEDENILEIDELFVPDPVQSKTKSFEKKNEAMLWHVRLGHPSLEYLRHLQKIEPSLKKVDFDKEILDCSICKLVKSQKKPCKEKRRRAERQLQIIHADNVGPIKPISYPNRRKFLIVSVDDYSRLARAYSIKTKDETGDYFEKFLQSARNLLGKEEKVCYLRSDQGGEFAGGKCLEVMDREGIEWDPSPPYTPQLNGLVERCQKTLQCKIRAYMLDSGLPGSMWELAVEAAVHAYNRSPHKGINFETPINRFAPKVKTHFDKIKRFGCLGYVKISKASQKFANRAITAILVGYTTTGYLLWHPRTGKFIESKHVDFNEKKVYRDVFKDRVEEAVDQDWLLTFEDENAEVEAKVKQGKK